jgi:hypothetical protein
MNKSTLDLNDRPPFGKFSKLSLSHEELFLSRTPSPQIKSRKYVIEKNKNIENEKNGNEKRPEKFSNNISLNLDLNNVKNSNGYLKKVEENGVGKNDLKSKKNIDMNNYSFQRNEKKNVTLPSYLTLTSSYASKQKISKANTYCAKPMNAGVYLHMYPLVFIKTKMYICIYA